MGVLDRILIIASGILMLLTASILGWTILGSSVVIQWLASLRHAPLDGWIVVLFLLLIGVYLFLLALKTEAKKALIHRTDLGEVRISLHSVQGLIVRAALGIKGVKDVSVTLGTGDKLDVKLDLQVLPDYHLPELTEAVQSQVRTYLEETVGITVNQVEVLVKGIVAESKTRVE